MAITTSKQRWLMLALITALTMLFAWVLAWRVPGFGGFGRFQKIIWFAAVFLLMGAVFTALRPHLWRKLTAWQSISRGDLLWQRLIPFVLFCGIFIALFTFGNGYLDNRYVHAIRIENSANQPLTVQHICLANEDDCLDLPNHAKDNDILVDGYSLVLQPGQVINLDAQFFYPPFERPDLSIMLHGLVAQVVIDGTEQAVVPTNTPLIFTLGKVQPNLLWQLLYLTKIVALVLATFLVTFLLIPLDLLQRGKVKSLRLHTFLVALVLVAFAIAFAETLTPAPTRAPLAGLNDVLRPRLTALHFDSYLTYVFVAVVLGIYYLVKPVGRWLVLLIASYLFLFSFDPAFPLLLLAVTLVTYFSGRSVQNTQTQEDKKIPFRRGALSLIAILLFFKYAPLLWGSASVWLGATTVWPRLLLPLGLSFYIFTALSYLMDVRAGKLPAVTHFGKFALYLAYFPKLLIGPIERPKAFFEQLTAPLPFEEGRFVMGVIRVGTGLFKKLLISNRLAVIANTVFARPAQYTSSELLVGLLAFTFQVYIDFSAYCDIAIGLSHLFGIQLSENFEQPYFAPSVADFWRRWHITFSQWLRDYVFLPLEFETRRVREKSMQYINILLTFLISGMWHGATLNFLVWGGLFGVYQIVEDLAAGVKAGNPAKENGSYNPLTHALKVAWTFTLVALAWVFFRAESYPAALAYFEGLFSLRGLFVFDAAGLGLALPDLWLGLLLIPFVLLYDLYSRRSNLLSDLYHQPLLIRWAIFLLAIFVMILFGYYGNYQIDFVYMQF